MKLREFLRLGVIVGPLPATLTDGTVASAVPVMANFNWLLQQVNANAAPAGGGGSSGGAVNFLYNGAMQVAQRGTSFALNTTAFYGLDRWQQKCGAGGSGTLSQITSIANAGFQYAMRVQRTAANAAVTTFLIGQSLESVDSYPLQGQSVTLSFWGRCGANYSPAGSALVATVVTGTGTNENVIAGYTGAATGLTVTATLTTSWQRFQAAATLSGALTEAGVLFTMTPVGTAGANDYFDIAGVQLEIGSSASAFSLQPFGLMYDRCLRYYQKSFPYATQAAQATSEQRGVIQYKTQVAGTAAGYGVTLPLSPMFANPTMTYYSVESANTTWYNRTQGADSGASISSPVSAKGFTVSNPQISSDAAADLMQIHWQAEAEL